MDKLYIYIYNEKYKVNRRYNMKDYLLKMPVELHSKVKTFAFMSGKTMVQFIIEAINEKLERESE
jgi:predicted DNA-binding protein